MKACVRKWCPKPLSSPVTTPVLHVLVCYVLRSICCSSDVDLRAVYACIDVSFRMARQQGERLHYKRLQLLCVELPLVALSGFEGNSLR